MKRFTPEELGELTQRTLSHYDARAAAFWEGTRDHDVSQNYAALLGAVEGDAPHRILDLGCGPGRDVAHFRDLGHEAVGLDGSAEFVAMARAHTGCEVLHQNFLQLSLEPQRFDGIFANASLFHVPTCELARVLADLRRALVPRGVLFTSNPRGDDTDGFSGSRYGVYHSLETWRALVAPVGFEEVTHYYRPHGKPRAEQPWLASVWRKVVTREEAFDVGARLFDAGSYWDAHEAWEERWRIESDAVERLALQGLIQTAAALHKLVDKSATEPAASLFAKALEKLDGLPADHALGAFRDGVRACADALAAGRFDRAAVPRLLSE
jgi:SAM-dependent methyltransferase